MDRPFLPRQVVDGRRILRFSGAVLAAATSERPGAPRWTEFIVYAVADGTYLVARIGHSLIVHQDGCPQVSWRMPRWTDADPTEQTRRRVPCPQCRPLVDLQRGVDPQAILETRRSRVHFAATAADALHIVTEGRPADALPRLVAEVVRQMTLALTDAL